MDQTGDPKQSMTPLEWRVSELRKVHEAQGSAGNWNVDRYMRGLFNGLELALAIMEGREVSYRDVPEGGYLNEPNERDFKKSLQVMVNLHGWDAKVGLADFLLADLIIYILQGMQSFRTQQQQLELREQEARAIDEQPAV